MAIPRHASDCRLLHARDQCCVAAVTALCLLSLSVYAFHSRGRQVDIDRAPALRHQFLLDINQADWPEWTLLPGIGETLARRIVESRTTQGRFRCHDDLLRVYGIGRQKLEHLRPFLLPVP
jgi:competence protein ComEA